MKRWMTDLMAGLLAVLLCVCCAACGKSTPPPESSDVLPVVISEDEYIVYQNVFIQKGEELYLGKKQTKDGIFCRLYDLEAGVTRYYVWGYCDETRHVDWQWELKVKDTSRLPADGSRVTVTGTLKKSEDALVEYWLEKPSIQVTVAYTGPSYDINMACMSAGMASEQVEQLHHGPAEARDGKQVSVYGRVLDDHTIHHPYEDGFWTLPVQASDPLPQIGTMVLVTGTYRSGEVVNAAVLPTELYGQP